MNIAYKSRKIAGHKITLKTGIRYIATRDFQVTIKENGTKDVSLPTIYPGQTLKARSVGDYDCIYEIQILSRTAKMATYRQYGQEHRTKIHTDQRGEYLRPNKYSFAPTFRPEEENK